MTTSATTTHITFLRECLPRLFEDKIAD